MLLPAAVIAIVLLFAGGVQAQSYTASGSSTAIVHPDQTFSIIFTTNSFTTPCWSWTPPNGPGDTFTYTETLVADNANGGGPTNFYFKIELSEWKGGAVGNSLDGPKWTNVTVQAGQAWTGSHSVTGTYTGWNGATFCYASFHVYRGVGVGVPISAVNSTVF